MKEKICRIFCRPRQAGKTKELLETIVELRPTKIEILEASPIVGKHQSCINELVGAVEKILRHHHKHKHDHEYFHDGCGLCQTEKEQWDKCGYKELEQALLKAKSI